MTSSATVTLPQITIIEALIEHGVQPDLIAQAVGHRDAQRTRAALYEYPELAGYFTPKTADEKLADIIEDVEFLRSHNIAPVNIVAQLGTTGIALHSRLTRNGSDDLAQHFAALANEERDRAEAEKEAEEAAVRAAEVTRKARKAASDARYRARHSAKRKAYDHGYWREVRRNKMDAERPIPFAVTPEGMLA